MSATRQAIQLHLIFYSLRPTISFFSFETKPDKGQGFFVKTGSWRGMYEANFIFILLLQTAGGG
jgi:hypothetical protein